MNKDKPQFMITYLCSNCEQNFALTELQKPKCFYCEAEVGFSIVKKEKITPEVMAARLKLVTDRMMENLTKAYESRPDEVDEQELLEAMQKAKELKEDVSKLDLDQKDEKDKI